MSGGIGYQDRVPAFAFNIPTDRSQRLLSIFGWDVGSAVHVDRILFIDICNPRGRNSPPLSPETV